MKMLVEAKLRELMESTYALGLQHERELNQFASTGVSDEQRKTFIDGQVAAASLAITNLISTV